MNERMHRAAASGKTSDTNVIDLFDRLRRSLGEEEIRRLALDDDPEIDFAVDYELDATGHDGEVIASLVPLGDVEWRDLPENDCDTRNRAMSELSFVCFTDLDSIDRGIDSP